MFCERCGSELNDDYMFCDKCGHPVNSMVNDVSSQPSVPVSVQPWDYGNQPLVIANNKKKGLIFFVGVAIVAVLLICIGVLPEKNEKKKKTNFEQQQPNEYVTSENVIHENHDSEILTEEEVSIIEDVDLGAYGQCIGYWAKNNVDTLSAETMWIQPPLVMEITEEFVMIHGPDYRANREDLQYDEINGIDYFTSVENGFRFYYSSSESLLVLELKTDSGEWMRWADFK